MRISKRKVIIGAAICLGAVIAFFGLRSYIFSQIHSRVDEAIHELKRKGYDAGYERLAVHWGTNLLEVHGLFLEKPATDTSCASGQYIRLRSLKAEGFGLFPMVFRGIVSFDRVSLDSLEANLRQKADFFPAFKSGESDANEDSNFALSVDKIVVTPVLLSYRDSARCDSVVNIHTALTLDDLALESSSDNLAYSFSTLVVDQTEINLPVEMYTLSIQEIRWDLLKERLRMDSIEVIPGENKLAFGRKRGFEIDRFDALIPYIELREFSTSLIDSSVVSAGHAEIQFFLKVFRDKRLPFVKKEKPLPIAQLRQLPFALRIDSLQVKKSFVQYEEFAVEATEAGKVYFDNLYASIYNINNRSETGETTLTALANLLGHGQIDLKVRFPFETREEAELQGSISDFKIPEINTMLIPSTNLKVESGLMNRMSFHFRFDDSNSKGEVELNYEDLKLAIFKEVSPEEGEEPDKDNFKSFIMNTFIFRTNMDERVDESKRTGAIGFERDEYRSIFNYWVKSLLSGIKAAYNLDKLEARKTERELRKIERLARREARKQKRAQRKREQG